MIANFIVLILLIFASAAFGQRNSSIEDIRLVNSSPRVRFAGRVEVRYNGQWGTICDNSWSLSDAIVACRMLNFDGAECHRTNAYFGRASSSVPIWMDRLGCSGREPYLDACPFRGWGPRYHFCTSHRDDSSAVCRNASMFSTAALTLVNTTTSSITVTFPRITTSISSSYRRRYRIQYNASGSPFPRYTYYTPSSRDNGPYTVTIFNLDKDTEYSFAVRYELTTTYCRFATYYNSFSDYSEPITVKTNVTARPSNFQIRLVSPIRGLDFLGRVEVNYNNGGWGTVCDYRFDISDANVICQQLNYTRAACAVSNGRIGRGTVPIFMTNLLCSRAEILDDCSYTRYRNTFSITRYCRANHYDDAGVICYPRKNQFLPAPQNLTISASGTTVILRWKRYIFPSSYLRSFRLLIQYTRSDRRGTAYSYYASTYTNTQSFYRIPIGVTINATITPQGRFTQYSCYTYMSGTPSDTVSITTQEQPPSTAPRNFHVSVVNCSAIIADWNSPLFNDLNGVLRGYKLMYSTQDGNEVTVELNRNETEYVLGGLQPSTRYTVSVLAYTVADGPRSIHLKVTTNSRDICQTDVIDFFGLNGNDFDRGTFYSFSRSINIFCGSSLPNAEINWFYSNGSRVGSGNRHLREGHFTNGTTVLQIGNERRLTLCDAGIYTCRANITTSSGVVRVQQRTYRVIFNRSPPTPQRPILLTRTHDSATVSWIKSDCDGGHEIQYYNLRISYYRSFFSFSQTNRYINNIDSSTTNYTFFDLEPRTTYYVAIQALGRDSTSSGYSSQVTFVTLSSPPTPPRYVTVKLVSPDTIMVNWTRPSVSNGVISYYTVYAMPLITRTSSSRSKRDADNSLQTVAKNFSATVTSGNITLPQVGVQYHVQVSATVLDSSSRINRESLFSPVTTNSTIYVPIQGLPVASNVRVSSTTNNSITVSWNTPSANGDTIIGYLIEYSTMVEGKSPGDNLIQYTHGGNFTAGASATSFVVQPLLPTSTYQLKIAVLTNRGEGKEVTISGTTQTAKSDFEKFVYFHVRFGPVFSCASFRRDIEGQENNLNKQIFDYLRTTCNCGFTNANIETGFFSCGQQDHQIIYRAHILGTASYSAIDLVNLLQNWILTDRAYVTLKNFRMQLDSTCPTRLDTLDDPECPVVTRPPPTSPPKVTPKSVPTDKPTVSMKKPSTTEKNVPPSPKETEKPNDSNANPQGQSGITQAPAQHGALTGESLVILFVGLIIAFLFLILIVLLIVGMFWKFSKQSNKSSPNVGRGFTNAGAVRFSDLEQSGRVSEQKLDDLDLYSDTEKFEDDFNY